MSLSSHAKKTAKTLLRANHKFSIPWRHISINGYTRDGVTIQPGVNHATLCRFAKSKGTWIPASIEIQKALGIHRERQRPAKMIADMSTDELLYALQHRAPLIANHTKKAMTDFIRACKAGRTS